MLVARSVSSDCIYLLGSPQRQGHLSAAALFLITCAQLYCARHTPLLTAHIHVLCRAFIVCERDTLRAAPAVPTGLLAPSLQKHSSSSQSPAIPIQQSSQTWLTSTAALPTPSPEPGKGEEEFKFHPFNNLSFATHTSPPAQDHPDRRVCQPL